MANPTSNFGWQMPTNTDLVKDLPADFEVFGQAVDTSLMDLKGGTTGQVLSKASNTDMDFTWVTSDDANAIQNTIVDAKGDLISASAADVPARLAVGSNGQVLTADSSTATGLKWANAAGGGDTFAAGKNKIINGDFRINQRSFTSNTTEGSFNFDRWVQFNGGASGTLTITPQTFTPGTAPVSGYEGVNFVRNVTAAGASADTYAILSQKIEDVRTLANRTATLSFWAKANTGTPSIGIELAQAFGSGGSAQVNTAGGAIAITTSWARYSATVTIPSISGKTIGTGSSLNVNLWLSAGSSNATRASSIGLQNNTFDIWGVQLEASSSATDFQTATGTLAGELAACQRYYWEKGGSNVYEYHLTSAVQSTSEAYGIIYLPVEMRTAPSASVSAAGDIANTTSAGTTSTCTAVTFPHTTTKSLSIKTTSGAVLTAGNACVVISNNTNNARIRASAEL